MRHAKSRLVESRCNRGGSRYIGRCSMNRHRCGWNPDTSRFIPDTSGQAGQAESRSRLVGRWNRGGTEQARTYREAKMPMRGGLNAVRLETPCTCPQFLIHFDYERLCGASTRRKSGAVRNRTYRGHSIVELQDGGQNPGGHQRSQ